MPKADDRLPSQRQSREERAQVAEETGFAARIEAALKEREAAVRDQTAAEVRCAALRAELAEVRMQLEQCAECVEQEPEIVKSINSSSAFDRHAPEFGKLFVRYPPQHLPQLVHHRPRLVLLREHSKIRHVLQLRANAAIVVAQP